MASTKLTLTVKPEIVQIAKLYARRHGTSVSATFSRFIRTLASAEQNRALNAPSGSVLAQITGILTVPEGQSDDDLRFEALVEKYGLDEESRRSR
jgi:hypothetical protein